MQNYYVAPWDNEIVYNVRICAFSFNVGDPKDTEEEKNSRRDQARLVNPQISYTMAPLG